MPRTIIPAKVLQTIKAGPFHANLKRWETYVGQLPKHVIEIWEGYFLVSREEIDGEFEHRWAAQEEELAIMVAKRAFGMTQAPTYEKYARELARA